MPRAAAANKASGGKFQMSDEHKAQLATGREQSRIVREYLSALETNRPKRGRKRTPESVEKRIAQLAERIEVEGDPLKRLQMIAEREILEGQKANLVATVNMAELEESFVAVVQDYSLRKNIPYAAWREAGVSASVLKAGNVPRGAV